MVSIYLEVKFMSIISVTTSLFFVLNALGNVPFFVGILSSYSVKKQRRIIVREMLIALGFLVCFNFFGNEILKVLGIDQCVVGIAGGTLLFLIALDMVFARISGTRSTTSEQEEAKKREDISVFPLAFPFIAGPGALATILLAAGEVGAKPLLFASFLGVVALVLAVCWVLMLATPRLMRALGVTGANVVSRLSGVILAALAVQFIIDGIRGSFL